MSTLAPAELFKYPSRVETFIKKYKKKEPFELVKGGSIILVVQKGNIELLQEGMRDASKAKSLLFMGVDGKNYRLGQFKKTGEFGGKDASGKKTTSAVYYGALANLKLKDYDVSDFSAISSQFAGGKLVTDIKEESDVLAVSDFNRELEDALNENPDGMLITCEGFRFANIIGCIPVTNGEPKADIVLIAIDNKAMKLKPAAYISYKMGTNAKGFQNYSGLSEKSSPYIFNHKETKQFYKKLAANNARKITDDEFQIIKDPQIIGMSVWGMDYGKGKFGVNNCHFLAQGKVTINGSRLSYSHTHKNGDFNFSKEYQPVFGARYTKRNNKGPDGIYVANYRIGIFPRAYRTAWLS